MIELFKNLGYGNWEIDVCGLDLSGMYIPRFDEQMAMSYPDAKLTLVKIIPNPAYNNHRDYEAERIEDFPHSTWISYRYNIKFNNADDIINFITTVKNKIKLTATDMYFHTVSQQLSPEELRYRRNPLSHIYSVY